MHQFRHRLPSTSRPVDPRINPPCGHMSPYLPPMRLLLFVVFLLLLGTGFFSTTTVRAAGPPAECRLHIEGEPGAGIRVASLRCTGGQVTGNIHQALLGAFSKSISGILHDPAGCNTTTGCLLSVCGTSKATFLEPTIVGVEDQTLARSALLCTSGDADMRLVGGRFLRNWVTNIWADGRSHVSIINTSISDNVASEVTPFVMVKELVGVQAHTGSVIRGSVKKSALLLRGQATVLLKGSTFSNNLAAFQSGSAVMATDRTSLRVLDTAFHNQTSIGFAGGAVYVGGNCSATFTSCTFADNVVWGSRGAGLAIVGDATVGISSCLFVRNAAMFGGGITMAGRAVLALANHTRFIDNRASFGGGALNVEGSSHVLLGSGTVLANNSALFGGGVYISGEHVWVNITGSSQLLGNSAEQGGADVSAGADGNLVFGDTNLDALSPTVSWKRRVCLIGEYSAEDGWCRPCPANTYSVAPPVSGAAAGSNTSLAQGCCECPGHAACPGRDKIVPAAGWWHSHPYSAEIHACFHPDACSKGGGCSRGYVGHACGACEAGFGSQGVMGPCGNCLPADKTLALFLVAGAGLVLLCSFLVYSTFQDSLSQAEGSAVTVKPSNVAKLLVRHMQLLAIVSTVRVQWPACLSGVFGAAGWLFTASTSQVVSLDCLFAGTSPEAGHLPLAVKRLLVHLLAPAAVSISVLLLCLLWQLAAAAWQRRKRLQQERSGQGTTAAVQGAVPGPKQQLQVLVPVACIVLLNFFYPGLVKASLSFFACVQLDQAGATAFPQYQKAAAPFGWWTQNVQQACYEGYHRPWAWGLGLPATLLLCLGVPGGMWLVLHGMREQHLKQQERQVPARWAAYSFLHCNYRQKRYYYEVLLTLQLAAATALSVFTFSLSSYFTMLLLNVSVVVFWAVQLILRPYVARELHLTSLLSLGCIWWTTSIALSLFSFEQPVVPAAYREAAGLIGLLLNLGFVAGCCYRMAVHSRGSVVRFWACCTSCLRVLRAASRLLNLKRDKQGEVPLHGNTSELKEEGTA